MTHSADGIFGEELAARYDAETAGDPAELVAQVARLEALAGGGRVLEFAIGTGRVALPLAAQGVDVAGIDMSRAMVKRLRAKAGGAALEVLIGDIAEARVEGAFALVYLVFNTIGNLTTQAAQTACFRNAAAHLAPGGRFVIETNVPPLQRLAPGERLLPFAVSDTHWGVDEIDVASQSLISHHIQIEGDRAVRHAVPQRYVWPAELDLMAELAGLSLESRWGGWQGEAFTEQSRCHVTCWRKPLPDGDP